MREYEDIKYFDQWDIIEKVNKGWSDDKKFYIKTKNCKELLLRISDISEYEKKKAEFEKINELKDSTFIMSSAIDFGICNNGRSVYGLYTWVHGEDARDEISSLAKKKQYELGISAGKYLKEIHSLKDSNCNYHWYDKFNKKIDRKISTYKECGIVIKNDDIIIKYLNDNRELLKGRPVTFQHGDYHIGNMIITPSEELGIIDFNRIDYGDPWEEFNRIVWSAEASSEFASGYINGYFNNEVPDKFFRLMLLYILSNQIGSIAWAAGYGKEELDIAIKQAENIVNWYNKFESYIPNWYVKEIKGKK